MVDGTGGYRHFHDELAVLKQRLLAMSERAESLVELSMEALWERDREKAIAVIDADRDLDRLEVETENLAISLLALQQPMARDLRFLIGAIKVSSDVERVGDHAVNIAQSAVRIVESRAALPPVPSLAEMARRARAMLSDSLDAFIRADGALGRKVGKADAHVDELHEGVFRVLLTHMMADARTIAPSLELLLVSRNLERVADLATNIGEDAVYLAEGKQIRHRFDETESDTNSTEIPLQLPPTALASFMNSTTTTPLDTRIAAIDIGSNSVRQIVADVSSSGQIRVVDEMKTMPRLGEGLERTGALGQTALDAAVASVQRMVTLARQLGAARIEIVATSAVRDASNGAEFTSRVLNDTGLAVRVLSGEEEALISFRSALAHFELGSGRSMVVDIGGGSLELVLAKDGLIEHVASFAFGAVRLTEKFLHPVVRPRGVRALREYVRDGLKRTVPVKDWRGTRMIGSGGTFTNLARIVLARQSLTARSAHGTRVSRVEVEHVLDWLQRLAPEERANIPGLNPARADIIVAGLATAAEVMARFDSTDVRSSVYGIREGILLEAAEVTPVVADPGAARERSLREFAERCHYEEPHARHVQMLALQLFDALAPRLGLGAVDRRLLSDAALLHDVGYHINYENHNKHSYHLISHADLLGMTPAEKIAIAHIARYHRGSVPKKSHRAFAALDRVLRERITKLSALLRFADGFDRGHIGAVARLKMRWASDVLRVSVEQAEGASTVRLECWGASRKRGLLEQILERPVEVVAPDGTVVSFDEGDGE